MVTKMEEVQDEQTSVASIQIGANLRLIRKEKKLSLQRIEKISNNEFKASVVGAYERGERSISVARLIRLCHFYDVNPSNVLEKTKEIDLTKIESESFEKVKVDLTKLAENTHAEAMVVARFAQSILNKRENSTGKFFVIRHDDLRILAAVFGKSVDEFIDRCNEIGILAHENISATHMESL
jgi:transcriptional regulator with XRE-family HTH domain